MTAVSLFLCMYVVIFVIWTWTCTWTETLRTWLQVWHLYTDTVYECAKLFYSINS